MIAKLHIDTMKLAVPTSIGTFACASAGGKIGSLAYFISMTTNVTTRMMEKAKGTQTNGEDHCGLETSIVGKGPPKDY